MQFVQNRENLGRLAHACGVDTEFYGFDGQRHEISDETLVAVLAALGIDAKTDEDISAALSSISERPWRRILPPCPVVRADQETPLHIHLPHGWQVSIVVEFEDGGSQGLAQGQDDTPPRVIDGQERGRATFLIPQQLPLGYHRLVAKINSPDGTQTQEDTTTLVVTPGRLEVPQRKPQYWGMMAQLYSVRSRQSWGIGDLNDLREMCSLFGDWGADYLLINPLHAAEPVPPLEDSPYLPASRRFFNPIYIRPEDIPEVAYMGGPERALITWAGEGSKAAALENELLDRDSAWKAKLEALEVIYAAPRTQARQRDFERFCEQEGEGLEGFATWCALREKYGKKFPERLLDANSPYVSREQRELRSRIDFFKWLQWVMDEQLDRTQVAAKRAGMAFGIAQDLAVGVNPLGADVWRNPHVFAAGIHVGAPPDMYNQQGQDWSQPPWRPDRLAELNYQPLRDMARAMLRHAGLLRIDHVMGLSRLWWIPEGASPSEGAYVRYNFEATVGILLLEAQRAGAVLIGEDLGTVDPVARDYLRERGIHGAAVFWFEKDAEGKPLLPQDYPTNVIASVDTHDMPPVAGYLAQEHVDLRVKLDLLTVPEDEFRKVELYERQLVLERLQEQGLINESATEREIIEAMHMYLARTPARLLCVSLTDAVGERRTQNQPGTDKEYPNWCIPLADGTEQVVLVEELATNPRLCSLLETFTRELAEKYANC